MSGDLDPGQARTGLCSIILPCYNRAPFLEEALAAIRAQEYADWELIVVDDGSTDATAEILPAMLEKLPRPARMVRQANAGAYAARDAALPLAGGEYVAFYDSDDLWFPHHLRACIDALASHPEVDWVYGACRRVALDGDEVVEENSFYRAGRPRPFLYLPARRRGELHILCAGGLVRRQFAAPLHCGLQASVIRRRVFERRRFRTDLRNCEDQLFPVRVLKDGFRLAYFDDAHVVYRVHAGNTSAVGRGPLERRRRVYRQLIQGFERLPEEIDLTGPEHRALRRKLARELFWSVGYNLYWQSGQRREAIGFFRRALAAWPWYPGMWKTYLLARLRARWSTA